MQRKIQKLGKAIWNLLKQVVLRGGIPFDVRYPEYKPEVIEAMEEAKRISRDPSTKRYSNFKEALEGIDNEILTLTLVDTGTHADLFKM